MSSGGTFFCSFTVPPEESLDVTYSAFPGVHLLMPFFVISGGRDERWAHKMHLTPHPQLQVVEPSDPLFLST